MARKYFTLPQILLFISLIIVFFGGIKIGADNKLSISGIILFSIGIFIASSIIGFLEARIRRLENN